MERHTQSPAGRERDYDNRDDSGDLPIDETHALIASDKVEGTAVYNHASERLGSIQNFMVGKQTGKVEYAVLTFGGFLGMGGSYYPLPWKMLTYDTEQGGFVVDMDQDDLDNAPSYSEGEEPEYNRDYATSVYTYYGVPY